MAQAVTPARRGCGARGPLPASRRVPIAGSANTAPHVTAGKGRSGFCSVFSRRRAWKEAQELPAERAWPGPALLQGYPPCRREVMPRVPANAHTPPPGYCYPRDPLGLDIASRTKSTWATPTDTLRTSCAPGRWRGPRLGGRGSPAERRSEIRVTQGARSWMRPEGPSPGPCRLRDLRPVASGSKRE